MQPALAPAPRSELLPRIGAKSQNSLSLIHTSTESEPSQYLTSTVTDITDISQEWNGLNGVTIPSWGERYEWWREANEDGTSAGDSRGNLQPLYSSQQQHVGDPSSNDYTSAANSQVTNSH